MTPVSDFVCGGGGGGGGGRGGGGGFSTTWWFIVLPGNRIKWFTVSVVVIHPHGQGICYLVMVITKISCWRIYDQCSLLLDNHYQILSDLTALIVLREFFCNSVILPPFSFQMLHSVMRDCRCVLHGVCVCVCVCERERKRERERERGRHVWRTECGHPIPEM